MLVLVTTRLTPRAAASSLEELIEGATDRRPLATGDGKSGSTLESVVIDGERLVLKHLHPDGDWKLGNLGLHDGRTVLLDWTYPGIGPIAHDLAWYLALNRARIPESKETSIDALRASLEHRGIVTDPWWDQQVDLCLLGGLVQFGWEKALGDDDELGWWCERAREGRRWLA